MFRIEENRAEPHPPVFRRVPRVRPRPVPVAVVARFVGFGVKPAEDVLRRGPTSSRPDPPGRGDALVTVYGAEEDSPSPPSAVGLGRVTEESSAAAAAAKNDNEPGSGDLFRRNHVLLLFSSLFGAKIVGCLRSSLIHRHLITELEVGGHHAR